MRSKEKMISDVKNTTENSGALKEETYRCGILEALIDIRDVLEGGLQ